MPRSIHFLNVNAASGGKLTRGVNVTVANGLVAEISRAPPSRGAAGLQVSGPGVLAPGFVDTHVHGRAGCDVMRPGGVARLSLELLAQGVTSFLPTIVSAAPETMLAALAAARGDPAGARVPGLHLEGPFLAPQQPGMFPPEIFRDYDRGLWRGLRQAAAAPIRLLTVAAERLTPRQLDELRSSGAALSLGHTAATYEQACQAFDAGVARVTHAYNAMRGFHHRAPGAVGALLDRGNVDAELILDGLHVAAAPARLLAATRTSGSLVLITDSVPLAGWNRRESVWAGRRLRRDGGAVRLSSGQLAGSALAMDDAVRRAVRWLHVSPAHALRMAAETPCASIGLPSSGLRVGAPADLVLLTPDLHPRMTLVGGVIRWRRSQ